VTELRVRLIEGEQARLSSGRSQTLEVVELSQVNARFWFSNAASSRTLPSINCAMASDTIDLKGQSLL
jgi:hypothetical protein